MGDPAELKKENGWQSLGDNDEEEKIKLADPIALEDGEYSLIPKEFTEEAKESSSLLSDENQHIFQKLQKMAVPQRVRLALFGNLPVRNFLVHDKNKAVSINVLRNPKLQESEVLAFAQMKNISEDVLQGIARAKNWVRNYTIKLALVSNPKTPLGVAIRFLDHLHDRDLQNLARSRNVSSVLAKSAGRVMIKRKGAK